MRAVTLILRGLYTVHVAADWADIFDPPNKLEKTYLKPRCTSVRIGPVVRRNNYNQAGQRFSGSPKRWFITVRCEKNYIVTY